jgi:hypothetical protein
MLIPALIEVQCQSSGGSGRAEHRWSHQRLTVRMRDLSDSFMGGEAWCGRAWRNRNHPMQVMTGARLAGVVGANGWTGRQAACADGLRQFRRARE